MKKKCKTLDDYKTETLICKFCNSQYTATVQRSKVSQFCNMNCYGAYNKKMCFTNDTNLFKSGKLKSRARIYFQLVARDGNKCSICNLENNWNEKPIRHRVDHINGINNDNNPSNLRLVCPNCDSQLDTFCGRNIK